MKIKTIFYATILTYLCSCDQSVKTISIENPCNYTRKEIVETKMPFSDCNNLNIKSEDGKNVAYQITKDQKLLFPIEIEPHAKVNLIVTKNNGSKPEFDTLACGNKYPERLDDLAWENDLSAYRTYGPALEKTGEQGFGYDIWVKRVEFPVVKERYALELNAETCRLRDSLFATKKPEDHDSAWAIIRKSSYHFDHGNGLDCYKVGPTLGCGTSALMIDNQIVYPWCYKDLEIIENGPLRFKAAITFKEITIDDKKFVEKRTITLDAFSHLNYVEVEYQGLKDTNDVVIGLVVHKVDNPQMQFSENFISCADPTDRPKDDFGKIFTGVVFHSPTIQNSYYQQFDTIEVKQRGALGHVLGTTKLPPNEKLCYYFGASWSKYGVSTFEEWNNYLKNYAQNINNKLIIEIK